MKRFFLWLWKEHGNSFPPRKISRHSWRNYVDYLNNTLKNQVIFTLTEHYGQLPLLCTPSGRLFRVRNSGMRGKFLTKGIYEKIRDIVSFTCNNNARYIVCLFFRTQIYSLGKERKEVNVSNTLPTKILKVYSTFCVFQKLPWHNCDVL